MTRKPHALLAMLLLVGLGAGGCPPAAPDDGGYPATSPEPGDLNVVADAPPSAVKGQTVALSAAVPAEADAAALSFEWYQTFGHAVDLLQPGAREAFFVAPSLREDQTLRFRVDVRDASNRISSATIAVTIAADPEHVGGEPDGGGPDDPRPQVRLVTSEGTIVVELNREAAPLTVNNFLRYVDDGFYDGTIFHRVIADFVVQGGGFTEDLEPKQTRGPIPNEAGNGLLNQRGTIAMARTTAPDSATSQFFFNLVDNESLDPRDDSAGYAVFGEVVEGLATIDRIAETETSTQNGMNDVPVTPIVLISATRVERPADER